MRELDLQGVKFPKDGYLWRLYTPVVVGDEAIAQVVQDEPIPHIFVTGQMVLVKRDGTWRVIQSKCVGAGERTELAPTGAL